MSNTLHLYILIVAQIYRERHCVFWNVSTRRWSDSGCAQALGSDGASSLCACDHTTNFAVLFDRDGDLNDLSDAALLVLNVLSYVLCGASAICCLVVFTVLQTSKYGICQKNCGMLHLG